VRVPAVALGDVLELAGRGPGPDAGDPWECASGGEGGHDVRGGPPAPEPVDGPTFLAEGVQPGVADGPACAESFEDAPDPAPLRDLLVLEERAVEPAEHAFADRLDLLVGDTHAGDGGPGEQESASDLTG